MANHYKRTPEQNKRLYLLLGKLGLNTDDKEALTSQFSNGRTTHSSELTFVECAALIRELTARLPAHEQPPKRKPTPAQQELDRKRKQVIKHLRDAGYTLPDGRSNMPEIEAWVIKQKYKKPLNQHSSAELSVLIYQAFQVREHFMTRLYQSSI